MAHNHASIGVTYGQWVELTDGADATEIWFQVVSGSVYIKNGTSTQPDANSAGWLYEKADGQQKVTVADMSSQTGGRVWAKAAENPSAVVIVDHA